MTEQIVTFLANERDDGNKLYYVTKVELGWQTENVLENQELEINSTDDLFVTVQVSIDPSRHVKPLSSVAAT